MTTLHEIFDELHRAWVATGRAIAFDRWVAATALGNGSLAELARDYRDTRLQDAHDDYQAEQAAAEHDANPGPHEPQTDAF